jgi:hypothetical protein
MNVEAQATRPRVLLSMTVLCCTLILSGCWEEGCNLVGPDGIEVQGIATASSGQTIDLFVVVEYESIGAVGQAEAITVTNNRGGAVTVGLRAAESTVARGMSRGSTVTFTLTSPGFTPTAFTCTFSGRIGLIHDAKIIVHSLPESARGRVLTGGCFDF